MKIFGRFSHSAVLFFIAPNCAGSTHLSRACCVWFGERVCDMKIWVIMKKFITYICHTLDDLKCAVRARASFNKWRKNMCALLITQTIHWGILLCAFVSFSAWRRTIKPWNRRYFHSTTTTQRMYQIRCDIQTIVQAKQWHSNPINTNRLFLFLFLIRAHTHTGPF